MKTFKQYFKEGSGWSTDAGVTSKLIGPNLQAQVLWEPDKDNIKVQYQNIGSTPPKFLGSILVPKKGMKAKEFLDYVDKNSAKIRKAAKKNMGKKADLKKTLEEKVKAITSENKGHWHEAVLDDEGDGKTVSTFPKEHPKHDHKISGAEIKAGGKPKHSHTLDKVKG